MMRLLLQLLLLTLAATLVLSSSSEEGSRTKDSPAVYYPCMRRCLKREVRAHRHGNMTCSFDTPDGPAPSSQCQRKCSGDAKKNPSPSQDQTQCFCAHCQRVNATGYCEKLGEPIQRHECESLVCTGRAKYRGDYCRAKKAAKKRKKKPKKDESINKVPLKTSSDIVEANSKSLPQAPASDLSSMTK